MDLPGPVERRSILEIHLRKRNCDPRKLDITALINPTNNFNGADLEALVKEAVEQAFLANRAVSTEDLLKVTRGMTGFASIHGEELQQIRKQLGKLGARPAGRQP